MAGVKVMTVAVSSAARCRLTYCGARSCLKKDSKVFFEPWAAAAQGLASAICGGESEEDGDGDETQNYVIGCCQGLF